MPKIAEPLVVQKLIIPSTYSTRKRTAYPPQTATRKRPTLTGCQAMDGRKISVSTAAIGIHIRVQAIFDPMKKLKSRWNMCTGWLRKVLIRPSRIRHSQALGSKAVL
jgi:hypothetical protein